MYSALVLTFVCVHVAACLNEDTPGKVESTALGEESVLEALCMENLCNCSDKKGEGGSLEFRATCVGDKTKEIYLSDSVFSNESVPDRKRTLYVNVSNFTKVHVTSSFLSRWLAYKSCSLDIWFTSDISFPTHAPPIANSLVKRHVFAGIGVFFGQIDHLPIGLYNKKSKAELRITYGHIQHLNLNEMLGDASLKKLEVLHSTITEMQGTMTNSVPLYRTGSFSIIHSNISTLKHGALSLRSTAFEQSFSIMNSTIGMMRQEAVRISKGVHLVIRNSVVGLMDDNVFQLHQGSSLNAKFNFFGIRQNSLSSIVCSTAHNITRNVLYEVEQAHCHIEARLTGTVCESASYIDGTCKGNFQANIRAPQNILWPSIGVGVCLLFVIGVLIAGVFWIKIFDDKEYQGSTVVYEDAPTTYFAAPANVSPVDTLDEYVVPRTRKISQTSFGKPVSVIMHPDNANHLDRTLAYRYCD